MWNDVAVITGELSLRYRRERSLHGHDPRVLKSALQKYIRREERDKGLWVLVELDLFSLAAQHPDEVGARDGLDAEQIRAKAEAARTNLINRLVVMVSEEVNVHGGSLPVYALERYRRWCEARGKPEGRGELVAFFLALLASDKCRIISDYKTAFNLRPHYLPEGEHGRLVALHRAFLQRHDARLYSINYGTSLGGLSADDLADRAMERALARQDDALFWCGRLVEHEDATRGVARLWRGLHAAAERPDVTRALEAFYRAMQHREKPIYLYHALLLEVLRGRVDYAETPAPSMPDVEALYGGHAAGEPPVLDGFVHDRHTGVRRDDGRTVFAVEGALIPRESTRFLVPGYRELYVAFKRVLDAEPSAGETDEPPPAAPAAPATAPAAPAAPAAPKAAPAAAPGASGVERLAALTGVAVREIDAGGEAQLQQQPRAQRRTAGYKKAVFVGQEAVYKGPYGEAEVMLARNLRMHAAARLLQREAGVEAPTVQPWRELLRAPGGWYLVADNVGDPARARWETVSSRIESDVKVLHRGTHVARVSELEATPLVAPAGLWVATLQHLYTLYLLGLGDHGSHNVLVDRAGRAVGIDLEELRTNQAPASRLEALFKKLAARHRQIYAPHLASVRALPGPLASAARDELLRLGFSGDDLAAIEGRRRRWEGLPDG